MKTVRAKIIFRTECQKRFSPDNNENKYNNDNF